jgi:hypothetical protein
LENVPPLAGSQWLRPGTGALRLGLGQPATTGNFGVRFKTKQGILADALLLQESVKIRLRLLREIIIGSHGRRTVGGGAQGRLQPGNSYLLGTAISHPKIANP